MRILYVENDAIFASVVVREFLADHEVTVVPSIEMALDRVWTHAFDVALVDYDLDDGKGTTVVDHLRRTHFLGRIVGASSHDLGNAALLAAGADSVCSKWDFAAISEHLAGPEGTVS